jgi:hypothetical protein
VRCGWLVPLGNIAGYAVVVGVVVAVAVAVRLEEARRKGLDRCEVDIRGTWSAAHIVVVDLKIMI